MHAAGLDVMEANVETDGDIDMDTFVVATRGETGDLSDEKIEEISHSIREAIDVGEDAHVVFEPYYEAKHSARDYLEVKIFGDHHPDLLTEVVDELAELGLDIHKAVVDEHDDGKGHHTDVDIFYCRQLNPSQGGDPFGEMRLYEVGFKRDRNPRRTRAHRSPPHADPTRADQGLSRSRPARGDHAPRHCQE